MAKTSPVYARIDATLKNNAEGILAKLGISPSGAINMFYSQIVLRNGIPFDLSVPTPKPIAAGALSRAEFDAELTKGINSLNGGNGYSADEIDTLLQKEFGI